MTVSRQPPKRKAPRPARPERSPIRIPKRPYRDSALFHGALALALVGVAWLTGGGLGRAAVVGGLYFVLATAWSWWRFRRRIEREAGGAGRPGGEP
jgi:hypothetical protein